MPYTRRCARRGGGGGLAWLLAHMPAKHTAMLISTRAATHKTTYLEKETDARLSKAACKQADRGRLWMQKWVLEFPGAAMEELFFADECPT